MGFLGRLFGQKPPPRHKLEVCAVRAGSLVATVGESYRQDALRAVSRITSDASPYLDDLCDFALRVAQDEPDRRWFRAVLVREPDNEHDSNAIAVHADGGGHLGYLSREHAIEYRRVFESLAKRGYGGAACPATLTGGGKKSYGVVLALSSPGHILGDLHAEERASASS